MDIKMKRMSLYIPLAFYDQIVQSAQENKRSINQEVASELAEYQLLIQDNDREVVKKLTSVKESIRQLKEYIEGLEI